MMWRAFLRALVFTRACGVAISCGTMPWRELIKCDVDNNAGVGLMAGSIKLACGIWRGVRWHGKRKVVEIASLSRMRCAGVSVK